MPSRRPRLFGVLRVALAAVAAATVPVSGPAQSHSGPPLPVQVRFWADETELTGALPDEATADRLRLAVLKARPDRPLHDRLIIDPGRSQLSLPPPGQWSGLLLELALSTLDGSLLVTPETFAVSGLTDSLVTHAAVSERLKPLRPDPGGRAVVNRLCLVTPEDLALPQPRRPRPALRPKPLGRIPVALAEADYGPPPAPVRASPVPATEVPGTAASPSPDGAGGAEREEPFEHLEAVSFATHSHLVRYQQFRRIDAVIDRIRSMTDKPDRIVLRGFPDQAGRGDYERWLGESRARAVKQAFVDGGVPEERLSIEAAPPQPRGSPRFGTVAILIPQPAPAAAPAPPAGPSPGAGAAAGPADSGSAATAISSSRQASPPDRAAAP